MRNQVGWTWLVVAMQPSGAIDNLGARAWWIQTSLGPGQWLLLRQSSTHHFWPKGKAVLAERLGLTITLGWMKKWRADVIPYIATISWLIDMSSVFLSPNMLQCSAQYQPKEISITIMILNVRNSWLDDVLHHVFVGPLRLQIFIKKTAWWSIGFKFKIHVWNKTRSPNKSDNIAIKPLMDLVEEFLELTRNVPLLQLRSRCFVYIFLFCGWCENEIVGWPGVAISLYTVSDSGQCHDSGAIIPSHSKQGTSTTPPDALQHDWFVWGCLGNQLCYMH